MKKALKKIEILYISSSFEIKLALFIAIDFTQICNSSLMLKWKKIFQFPGICANKRILIFVTYLESSINN